MVTFSLDTNCLIDIEENRPDSTAIRALANAHARREVNVAVVAISASEKQKHGPRLTNFDQFCSRLKALELGHLEILKPMFYWHVGFWDWAYWVGPEMVDLERRLHDVLFPHIDFEWSNFCKAGRLNPNTSSVGTRWHNAKCDVQAIWSHIHHGRDIFVTSDRKFHAKTKLPLLLTIGARCIVRPSDAAGMLAQAKHAV